MIQTIGQWTGADLEVVEAVMCAINPYPDRKPLLAEACGSNG